MNDYLTFKKFIVPVIIQALFWVGVAICVIAGLVGLVRGQIAGVIILVLGPVAVRIYAELIILAFKMFEAMREIAENTKRPESAPAE